MFKKFLIFGLSLIAGTSAAKSTEWITEHHCYASSVLKGIEESQRSDDWQVRYVGMYFCSKLMSFDLHAASARAYTLRLIERTINDPNITIQTEALWLLGELVSKEYAFEQATTVAQERLFHHEPLMRMWSLVLYELLVRSGTAGEAAQKALAHSKTDANILVQTQALFLENALNGTVQNVDQIKQYIDTVLESEDWEARHFALYFLSKLVDDGLELDYAEQIVSTMSLDNDEKIKHQALWIIKKLVVHDRCFDEARILAEQLLKSSDWRLRCGAIDVLETLYRSHSSMTYREVESILGHSEPETDPMVITQRYFLEMAKHCKVCR